MQGLFITGLTCRDELRNNDTHLHSHDRQQSHGFTCEPCLWTVCIRREPTLMHKEPPKCHTKGPDWNQDLFLPKRSLIDSSILKNLVHSVGLWWLHEALMCFHDDAIWIKIKVFYSWLWGYSTKKGHREHYPLLFELKWISTFVPWWVLWPQGTNRLQVFSSKVNTWTRSRSRSKPNTNWSLNIVQL